MSNVDASSSFQKQTFLHRTQLGELRLSVPAPTVLTFEYQGFTDGSFIPFIDSVWEQTFGNAGFPVQVFSDTEDQTGYTSDFRTGLLPWSKRAILQTDVFVLLVKSRWVAMGIAIGRATLGSKARHVQVTTNRETFRTKLDAAVRRSFGRS
jgi:hypothetical protein